MAQRLACLAHNQKVGGSIPLAANNNTIKIKQMPTSRSLVDRGGFKIHWAEAPRQFESDSRHIFNIKSKTVDLPERSKGTGLGPVMFACAGSNPAVNNY